MLQLWWICTDITPRERAIANGQRSLGWALLLQLSNTFLKDPYSSQQSCFLRQTRINGNPQLVKPCIQSFADCTECTNDYRYHFHTCLVQLCLSIWFTARTFSSCLTSLSRIPCTSTSHASLARILYHKMIAKKFKVSYKMTKCKITPILTQLFCQYNFFIGTGYSFYLCF